VWGELAYTPRPSLYKNDNSSAGSELFVRGFPADTADEKVMKFFSKNGVGVSEVKRIKGKQ